EFFFFFFFSSRRRHTRWPRDWSSDVCSSDLRAQPEIQVEVWLRAKLSTTIVSPTAVIGAYSTAGTNFGTTRYSTEWGSAGRLLRSEERRVGKEWRSGWSTDHGREKERERTGG